MSAITALARAKINLFLHVTGRRDDGYHTLESLVCFAEAGDRLTARANTSFALAITGPFADSLQADDDNLVLRAARLLQSRIAHNGHAASPVHLTLEKNLPVASGIGGGSADAAATLRALGQLWRIELSGPDLQRIALDLGADVPVCLASEPRLMRGIGEILETAPRLPPAWLVLVNPMRGVSTAAVFRALDLSAPSLPPPIPAGFDSVKALGDWLAAETRNDLEQPARSIAPEIDEALTRLSECDQVRLARMSGSGATCFGLFDTESDARAASSALATARPDWWVMPAALGAS